MIDTSQQRADHILIISHDVIGIHMAGPGIRYWEMAHVLAAYHPVTLIAPRPIGQQATAFTCGSYNWGNPASLAQWLNNADIVVSNGMMLQGHPELAQIKQPLALDLYDPVMLENLELFRHAPADQRITRTQQDVLLLQQQLAAGDFFLCATERQRDLYIGALMVSGRITPDLVDDNAQLRNLIDVVSFGLPVEPPVKQRPVLRSVIPGIGADDTVLLWTGGLWDWMDPLTLVRAMPQVVDQCPYVRLVFLAGQHPGNTHPMRAPQEAQELAQALGLLDRHIFFYEHWVPYAQRADFLLEADIAISLHRDHLETAYAAIRSRFLDHLWARLPSVVSAGDAAAELVHREQLGRVVAINDVQGVATALIDLISDGAARQACRERARTLAQAFTWETTLQALLAFCRRPYVMSENTPPADGAAPEPDGNTERNAALSRLDQLWRMQPQDLTSVLPLLSQAKQAASTVMRWYMQPVIDQQNRFNAAVVQALHQMAESHDHQQSMMSHHLQALLSQNIQALLAEHIHKLLAQTTNVTTHLQSLQTQVDRLSDQVDQTNDLTRTHIDHIIQHLTSLQQQVDDIDSNVQHLVEATEPLHHHLADIEVHLCDIDDVQTRLAHALVTPKDPAESAL
jgi:glycosyltransferase involved in cell wall biosynthesis